MTLSNWQMLADVLRYGPCLLGAIAVPIVLRDIIRSRKGIMGQPPVIRYANVYDGKEAAYLAVPVENGDVTRLLWKARFEGGLNSPDYDVMVTEEAAKAAASARRAGR